MTFDLLNKDVVVISADLSVKPLKGRVIAAAENTLALRLDAPVFLSSDEEAQYLVASVRHENRSLDEIAAGQQVVCALTLVPNAKFNPAKPFDVSWWRGGGAAIGDIAVT